jgi:hypothetical protein
MSAPVLNLDGYTDVPDSKIAVVVTFLEMTGPPEQPLAPRRGDVSLERWTDPDVAGYRRLFREVGADWIWFGRLLQDETPRSVIRPGHQPRRRDVKGRVGRRANPGR